MSLFRAVALTKRYGDLTALCPTTLTIDAGEQVMLVGPNGSGKTTLLRMAAGLLDPTGGEVWVAGHAAGSRPARAALSFVGDTPVLYEDLSVWEHLEFIARLHGMETWEARAHDLLGTLGLVDRLDDLPTSFSRGMRQKVALALGLLRPLQVVLIDEPFVGLDTVGRKGLLDLLAGVAGSGAVVLIATHQPAFSTQATRLIALRDGVLVDDAPPSADRLAEYVNDLPLRDESS